MVGPAEIARRSRSRLTDRLESLPILALSVHSACNCRCVMCDIWKANSEKREITAGDLLRHAESIRALHVQRVMLTGGEPLLHRNLWALCDQLRAMRIRITLVTTGLLVELHASEVASSIDTVVISLDGPAPVHDAIRRTKGGFERILEGVAALRQQPVIPHLIARCVVQRDNAHAVGDTIAAASAIGFDEISFLAADVSSAAFNRPEPWTPARAAEIAVSTNEIEVLESAIADAHEAHRDLFDDGFVAGGRASLDRIAQYYRGVAGLGEFPKVQCNAPWVSAVMEPGQILRPCFFQAPYGSFEGAFDEALNGEKAVAFRRQLDVSSNEICRRCVCSLHLPLTRSV